jgi:hypothetical protein
LGCSKAHRGICDDSNTNKIVPEIMDYFYFHPGSWWVYQCVDTGEKDSVWISEESREVPDPRPQQRSCNCGKQHCAEEKFIVFSTVFAYDYLSYHFYADISDPGFSEIREDSDYFTDYVDRRVEYQNGSFSSPTERRGQWNKEDTLTVNNKLYHNVMHLTYPDSSYGIADWMLQAWYAKNVHLIKYIRKKDRTTWNLVKYNVIQ